MVAGKHLFSFGQGNFLISRNVKPWMFGLGMSPKENFFTHSTQFVFLTIQLVTGNAIMVAIDMCGTISIMGEWIHRIT